MMKFFTTVLNAMELTSGKMIPVWTKRQDEVPYDHYQAVEGKDLYLEIEVEIDPCQYRITHDGGFNFTLEKIAR